jgi:dipeptidyl aminopeptidase/acylaminoacyl peptidase
VKNATKNKQDARVPTCDWNQGAGLFMALRRVQKPVWLLQYDHEDHVLTNPADAMDYTLRMQGFFDHYLKGAPAPAWMSDSNQQP